MSNMRLLNLKPICWLSKLKRTIVMPMSQESGQSLVIVVLAMTAIMGMMALAVDGGIAFAMRTRMQTAADAAALSGARELALGNSESVAIARANQILVANGGDATLSTVNISSGQVNVTAAMLFDTYFAGVIGIDDLDVSARSSAVFGGLVADGGVFPTVVEESIWSPGVTVTLHDDEGNPSPGNYGWVRIPGYGNTPIKNVIGDINQGTQDLTPIFIGDGLDAKPGNTSSALDAVQVGKIVTIPLYKTTNGETGSNLIYYVSGFARFKITNADKKDKLIEGTFIEYAKLGGVIKPSIIKGNMGVALVAPPTGGTPAPTNTSAPTATNTPVPVATNTPVPPTVTNTPVPGATNTPVPPTATNTSVPPTATNTPVPPTATNTLVPTATNTPMPTATNTLEPTPEPVCVKWHPTKPICKEWE